VIPSLHAVGRVVLECMQVNQVAVQRQRHPVPQEPIDAVSQERCFAEDGGISPRRALSPKEIDEIHRREMRVQRDAEQTALGRGVDGQIEHGAAHRPVDDALNFAGGLLQNQDVVRPDEGHGRRLLETGHHGADIETRIDQARACLRGQTTAVRRSY